MKYRIIAIFFLVFWGSWFSKANAQVIVDGKNLNEDKEIHYIQLSYYINTKNMLPVFLIDFGMKDVKEVDLKQVITINTDTLESNSPAWVLNKLYKAGWEYLGDETYIQRPAMSMTMHNYTLRRRE